MGGYGGWGYGGGGYGGGDLGGASEDLAATRGLTQHDTRHLVLMNTASCHYAPHVPESTSLCLCIHYLLCSSNKVGPVRETLKVIRPQRIWMEAVSWATKAPPLKGNGPTHGLTDLKGWLTNTLGRKAAGGEGVCVFLFYSVPFILLSRCGKLFTNVFARLLLLQMRIHKYKQPKQMGLPFCLAPGSRGNLDNFAHKHAHVERLTGWAVSINLNKIQWCSPYIFSAWMSSPWEWVYTKAASPQMAG